MDVRNRMTRLAIGLLCCALGACQREPDRKPGAEKNGPAKIAEADTSKFFAGAASCSGQSCHGGLEPLHGKPIGQDEYTAWLTRDPHARAFRVLFDERSKRIARNLSGDKKAHEDTQKAHEDTRCLSCHVTPYAYAAAAPEEHARAETVFGVGCESCHGSASKWLAVHSTESWKQLNADQKRDQYGFVDFRHPAGLAQTCVGCHVGAPPLSKDAPPRDVNHDLIAAGHPRLNFELDVFLDNLPPHWNIEAKEKRDGADVHARVWAQGQMASAQAALELLAYRADEKNHRPWPEFAEYDCFACHHDLQPEGWRQAPGYGAGRRRGSLPWGTWTFTMPRLLGEGLTPPDMTLRTALDTLEKSMGCSAPNREDVAKEARTALVVLHKLRDAKSLGNGDRQTAQKWLAAFGRDPRFKNDPSWDAAMQLYLAMHSLDPASGQALRGLEKSLAFPGHFDSPRDFRPDHLQEMLKRLAGGETP